VKVFLFLLTLLNYKDIIAKRDILLNANKKLQIDDLRNEYNFWRYNLYFAQGIDV
jgi:hypothetical protein